jgi:3-hydroxyisobutyrate dehydrogenase-like beta-hydroxyacid dehydrogenase
MQAHQGSSREVSRKRVAFIGAGKMGGRSARRIANAGHELIICDGAAAVREAFEAEGAVIANTPAECAVADVVIIFVMNGAQAESVTLGENGLFSGIDPASPPQVLIMSTIPQNLARKIATRLATKGAHTIDAAVTGGPVPAEQGTLTILLGGDSADIDKVDPVLELMGRDIIRCGELGAGLTAKILNNMLCIVTMYLMEECYRLGVAQGMQPATVAAIVEKGTGQNFWTRNVNETIANWDALSKDPEYFDRMVTACNKDWGFAVALADEVGMKLPFLEGMMSTVDSVDRHALLSGWRELVDGQSVST